MQYAMRHAFFLLICVFLLLQGCRRSPSAGQDSQTVDTIPMMVLQIQKCSRLYTSEYKLRKIVVYNDTASLSGRLLGRPVKIDLPVGQRKMAIPMTATVKAYIDFGDFNADRVKRSGRKVEVLLPDPVVTLVSTEIDHGGVREKVPMLRGRFSDDERARVEQKGRRAILEALPSLGIVESARQSAVRQLMPLFRQMGFNDADVTFTFRKGVGDSHLGQLLKIQEP